jgi:hypothetical protein
MKIANERIGFSAGNRQFVFIRGEKAFLKNYMTPSKQREILNGNP